MDLLILHNIQQATLGSPCLLAAGAGVLSHLLYYIRGFRDAQTLGIITAHLAAGSVLYVLYLLNKGPLTGFLYATAISLSYYVALFTSIIIYRIYFHPLRRFPGPFLAKISKFYMVFKAQDGKLHEHQNAWIAKYGDIVRIGWH